MSTGNGIRDRVAVIGMGCTPFGEHWDKSGEDMVVDAAFEACEDAGIEAKDIEAAWVGTLSSSMSGFAASRPLKLDLMPITRIENACTTGMDTFRNACFAVAAGMYDIVLAVGFEKLKDRDQRGLAGTFTTGHPVFYAGTGGPGAFALAATRYFEAYGATKEHLGKIAVKNHHNGTLNPKAHFHREVTCEQVVGSFPIAYPLGLLDCAPTTDGAAAAIVCRADLAPMISDEYVLVKGLGLAVSAGTGQARSDYDYTHFPEATASSKQAYAQAGITDPLHELGTLEVHDCFTITELIIYEDVGLCAKGEAKDHVDAGTFELGGVLPVNTSGGLKASGHPVGATGLRMIYEGYSQILGRAGKRQVADVDLAMGLTLGGIPGMFTCGTAIVGRP